MNDLFTEDNEQRPKGLVSAHPPPVDPRTLRLAKRIVDKAIKAHRVFSIQGSYPTIRKALRARGWVEKYSTETQDNEELSLCSLMSGLLLNEVPKFHWTNQRNAIDPNDLQRDQIISHVKASSSFTSKAGLCRSLKSCADKTNADTFFPRCFRLGADEERHAFVEDYRLTACISLLKYIVQKKENEPADDRMTDVEKANDWMKIFSLSPMVDFARRQCESFLDSLDHINVWKTASKPSEELWAEFIHNYYLIVHDRLEMESYDINMSDCEAVLQRLRRVNPQFDIDGTENMWIIKPGAVSRERGSVICAKRLDHILRAGRCDPNAPHNDAWMVQKYIERPFLVFGTRFDVRQWFLVSDRNPLTVWFYGRCYLWFSTPLCSLQAMDSSVHRCDNSVQSLNSSDQRHSGLTNARTWLDEDFTDLLSRQRRLYSWETVTVPGMKKAVVSALLTAQDEPEQSRNTFELYEADFILDHDLHPWLIEITSSPSMAPSSPITATLCREVQEDTIRVMVDRREDPEADTGDFDMIYCQADVASPLQRGVHHLVESSTSRVSCCAPPLLSLYSSEIQQMDTTE